MYGLGGMLAKYGIGLPIQPGPMQQPQQPMGQPMGMPGMQPGMQPQMAPPMPQQMPAMAPQPPMGLGGVLGSPQNMFAMNASAGEEEQKDRGNRPWRVKVYEKSEEQRAADAAEKEKRDAYYQAERDYKQAVRELNETRVEDRRALDAGEITYDEYKQRREAARQKALAAGEAYEAMEDPRQYNEPKPGEGS